MPQDETYDNVLANGKTSPDPVGYANEAFDENYTDKKGDEVNESQILDEDIPETTDIPEAKTEEELLEERVWLDRVAMGGRETDERSEVPCQVVEVKAKEIVRSVVTAIESLVVPGPDAVEMVQIDDTDTEPESGSPAIMRRLRKAEEDIVPSETPSKIPKRILKTSPKEPNIQPKTPESPKIEKFPKPMEYVRTPKRKSLEITLRKEVEMLRTYELVSSCPDSDDVFMETKDLPTRRRCPEEQDSFDGSDKENDAAVEFSADEEENRMVDSDSSDDDSQMVSCVSCRD